MLTEKCIEKLKEAGFYNRRSSWVGKYLSRNTSPADALFYSIQDAGLALDFYGTGNIYSAHIDGEKISNTKARRMYCTRLHFFGSLSENIMTGTSTIAVNAAR